MTFIKIIRLTLKMQVYDLKINKHTCTGCNICCVSCPINFKHLKDDGELTEKNAVVLIKNGLAYPIYIEEREVNCDGCGVCIENCPQKAIKIQIIEAKEA